MNDKPTVVLGLGNPLMADEGVGVRIIEKLQSASRDFPEADFIDAGTGGMSVLHCLSHRTKAVIIDCALMAAQPGTIKRFTPEDVQTVKQLAHISLHEADILKIIELAKQLGDCPDQIVFFGIEPAAIENRIGLSELIEAKLDHYIRTILKELKK